MAASVAGAPEHWALDPAHESFSAQPVGWAYLRRYVGTQMTIQHGLVAASQQLGHSNPMTTARYYQTGRLEPNQANDML